MKHLDSYETKLARHIVVETITRPDLGKCDLVVEECTAVTSPWILWSGHQYSTDSCLATPTTPTTHDFTCETISLSPVGPSRYHVPGTLYGTGVVPFERYQVLADISTVP